MPENPRTEWTNAKQDVWNVVFQLHRSEVWALVYSRTRNADVATDMTQEVFKRYFEAQQLGQQIGHVRSWLLQTARHLVADHEKCAYVRRRVDDPSSLDACCSPCPQPFELLDAEEQWQSARRILWQLWSELGDKEKGLLVLHVNSRSLEEIGDCLGSSRSAVGRQFALLRARLIRHGSGLPTAILVATMVEIINNFRETSGMQVSQNGTS